MQRDYVVFSEYNAGRRHPAVELRARRGFDSVILDVTETVDAHFSVDRRVRRTHIATSILLREFLAIADAIRKEQADEEALRKAKEDPCVTPETPR